MRIIRRDKKLLSITETVRYSSLEECNQDILKRRRNKWVIKSRTGNIITYRKKK